MSQIDISIIVPCHNGAKYLPKLADSLKPLLTAGLEVVFVDDGSTDGSAALFQRLLPNAICLKQENCGVGTARNHGVEVARGEFLQLLDADDTIEPSKCGIQLQFARTNSLDVVYSDWRMITVEENVEKPEAWKEAEAQTEVVEALLGGWWYPLNAALVRREAYLSVAGCGSLSLEDFDLWVRLGIAGNRFGYIPGRFANYYRYLNIRSRSRKDPRKFFEGGSRVILNAVQLLTAQNAATQARCKAAARGLHGVARNVYVFDREWYRRLMNDVRKLDSEFRPTGSFSYRLTAEIFGLDMAERIATLKRRVRF